MKKTIAAFVLFAFSTLPLLGVTYQENTKQIVDKNCAGCHRGPFLDLRTFPFFSDKYPTQEGLMEEMIRRIELTDLKRMPPVNFPALTESETELLKAWFQEGLQP